MNTKIQNAELIETNQNDEMPGRISNQQAAQKPKPHRLSRRLKKELNPRHLNETKARHLERYIPRLAKAATTQAYQQALSSGNSIVIAEDGELVEVNFNGTKRTIRKIEPSVKMRKGQIIKIK